MLPMKVTQMAKMFGFNYSMLHILSQSKTTRYFQIKTRDKLLLSIGVCASHKFTCF